jgi:hypothetical protein
MTERKLLEAHKHLRSQYTAGNGGRIGAALPGLLQIKTEA